MATLFAPSRTDRAFERIYRRYVADVYRYVLAVLQNEADAEDATQTAFLFAYRAYERGERAERPLNWLIAIAHNVCRQRFRESARRPRLVELQDDVAARAADDEAPNAEEIRRALGFLAFNQRAALVMRELQGRSYDEIARILGVSTSAVETLLFRARRAMREQLEGGLSCGEAELALSKRADGKLSFAQRGPLRAHLRECPECAALERGQRFRRRAIRSIGTAPLPSSLGSFLGGGAVGTGVGVGGKAAAVVVAGVLGSGLAGDALQERKAALHEPAAAAQPRSARVQQRLPTARAERLVSVARRASAPWRLSPRRVASMQSAAAPAAAAGAALSGPAEEAPGVAPENPPSPPDASDTPAAPASPVPPAAPDVPALPVSPPAPVGPSAPAVPQPTLPQPTVPQPTLPQPTLPQPTPAQPPGPPELPAVTVPAVKLPEVPVELLDVVSVELKPTPLGHQP
jgi:RNA polymerase sigma factor (sigma-70 family)